MAHVPRVVLAVGILLVAGLVYANLGVPTEGAPPDAVQKEPALPRPVAAVEGALPARQSEAVPPALEREVAPPPVIAAGRTNTSARLVGRCVAAENGAPLAGCVIEIVARGEERGTTREDGCFAIDFVPMPSGSITVKAKASGRVSLEGQLLVEGSVGDLGTIRMRRGFVVSGRVVDPDGIGVPGHTVLVTDVDTALRTGQVSKSTVNAVCADDGSFTLGIPLPAGDWHARLQGPRRQRGDGAFRVHALTGVEPLALVVEPQNEITGVVVDEAGQALVNVGLCTEQGGAVANSVGNGAFELVPQQPVSGSTRILLRDPAWSQEFVPPTVAWGQRDLRIVIPSGPRLTVEVVDDAGAPVTRFGVLFGPVGPGLLPRSNAGDYPGGRIELCTPHRGRHVLRVSPQERTLLASEPRYLDVGATPLPVQRVVLERLHETAVFVVGADQAGVADAIVNLARVGDSPDLAWLDPQQVLFTNLTPEQSTGAFVSGARTDAEGRCSLFAPANCRGYVLCAQKVGFVSAFVVDPPLSVVNPLRVVLASGGALRGSVEVHEQSSKQFIVRITHVDGSLVEGKDLRALSLMSDCTFTVPVLPPGDYVVQVLRRLYPRGGGGFVPAAPPQRVAILVGQTTEVHFDARPVVAGSLAGRLVTRDASKSYRVQLVPLDAENAMFGEFDVADDGSFLAEELLPGRYHLAVRSFLPAVLAAVVEIAPGAVRHQDFTFTRRKLTLRFRTPAGEPATGNFELRCGPLLREMRLPESDTLVLDPAPELPIQVRYRGAADWSEAIAMPADRAEHTTEVVVRPRQ